MKKRELNISYGRDKGMVVTQSYHMAYNQALSDLTQSLTSELDKEVN